MDQLRVIFANIVCGMKYYGEVDNRSVFEKYWPSDYIETYSALEPDILCLAEAPFDTNDGRGAFVKKMSKALGAQTFRTLVDGKSWLVEGKYTGTAIFSKFGEVDYSVVPLPPAETRDVHHGEERVLHDKAVQVLSLRVGAQIIKVLNIHYYPFSAFGRPTLGDDLLEKHSVASQALSSTAGQATIITGDFNNSDEPDMTKIFPKLFAENRFRQAISFFPDNEPSYKKSVQIDQILYSPEFFEPISTQVVSDNSDHGGVMVDFRIVR